MTNKQIATFNERLALEKIRAAFRAGDMSEAMHLVHITMGIDDVTAAYNKVMGICYDLVKKEGRD